MFVREARYHSAAGRALKKADLKQVGFDHFLDGIFFFVKRGAERSQANRSAVEFFYDGQQELAVEFVQAENVDFHSVERVFCDVRIDDVVMIDLREIAHAAEQAVCDSRCSTRPAGDLFGAFRIDLDIENSGRAFHDPLQLVHTVEIQMKHYAEPSAKRCGYQAGPSSRTDQRKFLQRHIQRPRASTLPDHQVEPVIFHGGIKNFLDRRMQPMDLVDEKYIAFFEICEDRRKVAGLFDDRASGGLQCRAHLVRNNIRERRFTDARRAGEQNVIQRLASL